jgi:hypothetical protein
MHRSNPATCTTSRRAHVGIGRLALIGASAAIAATGDATTYTWSAELVAFDEANRTVTVKSLVVNEPGMHKVAGLSAGDRAMLTWSGINTAAGIRALEPGDTSAFDRLTMPIEYVSAEMDGRYVSFKVPIPAENAAAIQRLNPGDWVTATSPLHTTNPMEAVRSIRPYVDVE